MLFFGIILLMLSSERSVNYTLKISKLLGISELSAGFIILSLATSMPDFFVSVISAIEGNGSLGVGNVLGANITKLTLVLGLAVIVTRKRGVKFSKNVFNNLINFLFIASIIPLFILQTGGLSLVLGLILLVLFVFFAVKIPKPKDNVSELHTAFKKDKIILFIKFLIAISLVILSSNLIVDNGVNIAIQLNLPVSVIGATLIGFGTSLPELVTSIRAFRKGLFDIGLGNIIGSCIINLTLVLGTSSIIAYSSINIVSFTSLILFALLATIITWFFISTERRIDKKEALMLVGIYTIFILQELGFSLFVL